MRAALLGRSTTTPRASLVKGDVRQRPQICGYAQIRCSRRASIQTIPSRMINRVFECAEPSVWMGCNKLLFKRMVTDGERAPSCFLVVVRAPN